MKQKKSVAAATVDLDQEIAADAKAQTASPDMLARITTAGNELLEMLKKESALNQQLGELEVLIRSMQEQTLPALFDEAGVKIVGLDDNQLLERTEEVYTSISKANAGAAAAWLIANNYGAIVKAKVTIELEKDDTKLLDTARRALERAHIAFEESSGVNAATLRAFVKERLAAGTVLPDSISVHVQPRVTVKVPKKRSK